MIAVCSKCYYNICQDIFYYMIWFHYISNQAVITLLGAAGQQHLRQGGAEKHVSSVFTRGLTAAHRTLFSNCALGVLDWTQCVKVDPGSVTQQTLMEDDCVPIQEYFFKPAV